jgi:tRNA(His) 5'-end guanylyltransferase
MFGAYFNKEMGGTEAAFDCRVFSVPFEDVANVFIWRQKDWERNSLQMYARKYFSHKKLIKKKKNDIHEMLYSINKNWTNLKKVHKNGVFITLHGERISKKMNYEEINSLLFTKSVT